MEPLHAFPAAVATVGPAARSLRHALLCAREQVTQLDSLADLGDVLGEPKWPRLERLKSNVFTASNS